MKKSINFLKTLIFLIITSTAYTQPHINGDIEIDMKSGLLKCNFNLSKIPKLGNYRILLNKGMNIKSFKNDTEILDYDGHYNGKTNGEAIEYVFINPKNDTIALPMEFNIEYVGAFPIYNNEFNIFDYKGIIAFNGKTVRATEQSKWYPIIYDVDNDRYLDSYTYDVKVKINGGNTVFINGASPSKGKKIHLTSQKDVPLLLFAGDFDFVSNKKGDYIINAKIKNENIDLIFQNIDLIKNQLSLIIGTEFKDNIYLISHEAINKRKKGSSWGFNTYPTFAFTGLDFNKLIDETGKFSNEDYKYFGHEFAHNYFGNNVRSGKLNWFWSESFAEYLSYATTVGICGEEAEKKILQNEIKGLDSYNFIPLTEIKSSNEISEKYRYSMGPLIIKCFEISFGKDKMNKTISLLLSYSYKETLTLNHLKKAALLSNINENDYEVFLKKYVSDENFKQNVIELILNKIHSK